LVRRVERLGTNRNGLVSAREFDGVYQVSVLNGVPVEVVRSNAIDQK
jgi:hypothetical protein